MFAAPSVEAAQVVRQAEQEAQPLQAKVGAGEAAAPAGAQVASIGATCTSSAAVRMRSPSGNLRARGKRSTVGTSQRRKR